MDDNGLKLEKVTRITVVTNEQGRVLDEWDAYQHGVEIHLQDDGRTLKILPAPAPAVPTQSVLRAACGAISSHEGHTFYNATYDAWDYCYGEVH